MRVQCSIIGSALGSLTESPLHALNGNQDGNAFYGLFVRADSPRPAFDLLRANGFGPSNDFHLGTGDPVADAASSNTYCLQCDWGDNTPYHQRDAIDPDLFTVSSVVVEGTIGPFTPAPLVKLSPPVELPNDPPDFFASGSVTFDKAGCHAILTAAVMAIDLASIWAGTQIPTGDLSYPVFPATSGSYFTGFFYNRYENVLHGDGVGGGPYDGVLYQLADGGFGPSLMTGATDSWVLSGVDVSTGSGTGAISIIRAQVQIRGYAGTPIPYSFVEIYTGLRFNAGVFDAQAFYRAVDGADFNTDLQIVELPLPTYQDFPHTASTPLGDYVLVRGQTAIIVGQTFDEFLAERGITSDHVIS